MNTQPETSVGLEASINPANGEVGIGITVSRTGPLINKRSILDFFRSNDSPPQDGSIVDEIIARSKEYPRPDVSEYAVSDFWKNLQQQPKMTAIVSGKGGVGKTSIALGLTELYSATENVLLVDFDLHNRGLTSKYGPFGKKASTVLSEMKRFTKCILADDRLPRDNGKIVLSKLEESVFHDLREKFCYASFPKTTTLAPLMCESLYKASIRDHVGRTGARPSNCYFLPSRRGGESFLATPESRFDVAEVALFLTYLGCLAYRTKGITKIIIDCHGAHDLFMVGAILASQSLVVVTRPEPAAFEGTIELVRFAQCLVESKHTFPGNRKLVFNEYRASDKGVAEALFKAVYQDDMNEKFEDIPKIDSSDGLRDLFKYYDRPCILDHPSIGEVIRRIGLEKRRDDLG